MVSSEPGAVRMGPRGGLFIYRGEDNKKQYLSQMSPMERKAYLEHGLPPAHESKLSITDKLLQTHTVTVETRIFQGPNGELRLVLSWYLTAMCRALCEQTILHTTYFAWT